MSIDTNTRFLGVDSSKVDLSEKKDRVNNAKTEYYSLQDIYGYINPLVGLFSQTTSSTPIANTTTESSLIGSGVGSLSVPANAFKVGDSYHAKLIGHISCNSAATLRLKIKAGSVILADTGIIDLDTISNRHWEINVYFTIREIGGAGTASIASGGIFSYTKNSGLNFEGTTRTTCFPTVGFQKIFFFSPPPLFPEDCLFNDSNRFLISFKSIFILF
jgi:hypothetical protein